MKKLILLFSVIVLSLPLFGQTTDKFGNLTLSSAEAKEASDKGGADVYSSEKSSPTLITTIVNVIPCPTLSVGDLAFDGEHLWVEGYAEFVLYKISPLDGAVVSTIPTEVEQSYGLTHDGTNLWLADTDNRIIQKINPATGEVLQSFPASQIYPGGLAWDGSNLWHNDTGGIGCVNTPDSIFQIAVSGDFLQRRPAISECITGLAFDGQYLWSSDNDKREIYRFDPSSFSIVDTILAPGGFFPNGLTFDGQYLWVANNDSDSIYQIDFGFVTGLEDVALMTAQISVHPNPSVDEFVFERTTGYENHLFVILCNLNGQMILKKEFGLNNSITVDLKNYNAGMFFYSILNDRGKVMKSGKLIKSMFGL